MTPRYQSQVRPCFLLTTTVLILATGCQTSRMAKMPGMGWLASHRAAETQDDPMATYPAPSASAVPTTIADSRVAAVNAAATGGMAAPGAMSYAANQAGAGSGYPETSHPGLPPAPAAVPRAVSSVPYPPQVPSQMANPDYGSSSLAGGPPNKLNDDVQHGLYPTAEAGSATTWGAVASNTPASTPYPSPPAGIWNHNAPAPPGAAGSASATPMYATRSSDFDPMQPSVAAPASVNVAPASFGAPPATTVNPAGNALAGYDQDAFVASSQVQPVAHSAPMAPTTAPSPVTSGPALPAKDYGPAPSDYAPAPASGSHYATIAADQVRSARNGPWRPGSTSRLEAGAVARRNDSPATSAASGF